MITADTTPTFPTCPAFGFTVEPVILTTIIAREGGFERATRLWDQALRRFSSVPIGDRLEEQIQEILYFWLAIGGTSGRFRFKDYSDYKSTTVGGTPTALDQPLEADTNGTFQMIKQYNFGSLAHQRVIHRPIGSTIMVANESAVVQPSSDWTIDEATGLLEPATGFDGTPTTWGGEFDVYCRFDSELPIEITSRRIQSTSFAVREVRE